MYMNTILWIGQAVLAAAFLYSGICKMLLSKQALIAKGQTGVVDYSTGMIRFIAACEVLGVVGIIVPWLTGVLPVLTPVAAGCFAVLMMLAAPIHYRLKEPRNVATNIILLLIALF